MDHADRHRRQRYGYMPWTEMPEVVAADQPAWQSFLRHEYDVTLGDDVFIAPDALVWLPDGRIGDRTWLASHAVVRGDVSIGADCSINPYATVAGDVTIGDHVRIASLASVWGFNPGFDDPDRPSTNRSPRTRVSRSATTSGSVPTP